MRAVVITRAGGPDVLEIQQRERPAPAAREVLVAIRATALNRADLLQREGRYPPPAGVPADIPGLEFAGEVAALGDGTSAWRVGDRVFGITAGGAHAEYVVVRDDTLAHVPDGMSWDDAGAVPEAFITAHDALVTQAAVQAGERVLVHAVGSGVGLVAIQLARAWNAVPYGTARTDEKIRRAREHGLEEGVAVSSDLEVIPNAVAAWTGGKGVDITLDLVGGPYVEATIRASALKARIMLIGTVAGRSATLPLHLMLAKRITLRGTILRARSVDEKATVTRKFADEVVPLIERGLVAPVIDSVFQLDQIREAHARLESNETFGKVVVLVS